MCPVTFFGHEYSNLLGKETPENKFFELQVSKTAIDFLESLCSADRKPPEDVWDIYKACRFPLARAWCIKNIEKIEAARTTVFMFDTGHLSTLPWNIGVQTAGAALMICR